MNYTLLDSAGLVVGSGSCQEESVSRIAAPEGGQVLWDQTPPTDFFRLWRWNGRTFADAGPRFPTTYVTERQDAYPAVPEQLDMLWHAMDAGTTPPIEPWYSTIKAIKGAHPKP